MNDWLLAQGGLVGLGIAAARNILLLFSVASVAVMIERLWTLTRLKSLENVTYPLIRDALARRDFEALNRIAAESEAPSAGVLKVGLQHLEAGEVRLREAMNQEVGHQLAALQHNLPVLASAASTAPYIGLFGTVLGILAAFRDIARTGQTGASVIAGGISEALTATALGLGVAIPAVLAYNFFTARINSISLPVETHALDIAERLAVASAAPETIEVGAENAH
ncbi:MAG TPA: MotA/TolQ/ExbB proton channel family protein [Abditibacterium sp.]|jgi:biopolymer transport protein ExbB